MTKIFHKNVSQGCYKVIEVYSKIYSKEIQKKNHKTFHKV